MRACWADSGQMRRRAARADPADLGRVVRAASGGQAVMHPGADLGDDCVRVRRFEIGHMVEDQTPRPGRDRARRDEGDELGVLPQRSRMPDPVAHGRDGRAQGVGELLAGRVVDPLAVAGDLERDRLRAGGRDQGSGASRGKPRGAGVPCRSCDDLAGTWPAGSVSRCGPVRQHAVAGVVHRAGTAGRQVGQGVHQVGARGQPQQSSHGLVQGRLPPGLLGPCGTLVEPPGTQQSGQPGFAPLVDVAGRGHVGRVRGPVGHGDSHCSPHLRLANVHDAPRTDVRILPSPTACATPRGTGVDGAGTGGASWQPRSPGEAPDVVATSDAGRGRMRSLGGLSPARGPGYACPATAGCPSGQREQTVNLPAQPTLVRTQHPPRATEAPPHHVGAPRCLCRRVRAGAGARAGTPIWWQG